jgi:hypothetical protein
MEDMLLSTIVDVQANWRDMMDSGRLVVFVSRGILSMDGMPAPVDNSGGDFTVLTDATVMDVVFDLGGGATSLAEVLDNALARAGRSTMWNASVQCGSGRSGRVQVVLRFARELQEFMTVPEGAEFGVLVQRGHA